MLNKTRMLLATALLVSGSTWLAAPARADDMNPPNIQVTAGNNTIKAETWNRGDPLTTSAEWVFASAPNPSSPLAPDGTGVPLYVGDYRGITGPVAVPGPGLSPSALGWMNTSATDTTITFNIPNWIDFEPIKYLQVQALYYHPADQQIGSTTPVMSVSGQKNNNGVIVDFKGSFDYEFLPDTLDKHYRFAYYDLQPNPDWESVVIAVKPGYTIGQVVIDTISTPEPATASLLLIAGAVGLLRRRR